MIYRLFYYLVKFTCAFYFKKTSIYHVENRVENEPVIICANHGNSFMDAVLIAINSKRTLHFLVRSDVFNTPFKRWFFGQLNMMPIYRIRDGREALRNNDEVFFKCQNILNNNGAIVIFPEGNCVVEKRLRAFKTGFVHLAFNSTLAKLQVQAVAINYSNPSCFYSEASLDFLPAIAVEKIKRETQNKEFDFNKRLMQQMHQALEDNMVIIPDPEDDVFYEEVLQMQRNALMIEDVLFVKQQMASVQKLNQMKQQATTQYTDLRNTVLEYFEILRGRDLDDAVIAKLNISNWKLGLVFPFYFAGYLLNQLPARFIEYLVQHKIKEKQFKSSVRMVLSLFIYPIYLMVIASLLNLAFGNFMFSMLIIITVMLFYYAYFEAFNLLRQKKYLNKEITEKHHLIKFRSQIWQQINL